MAANPSNFLGGTATAMDLDFQVEDQAGQPYDACIHTLTIEDSGPVRARVRADCEARFSDRVLVDRMLTIMASAMARS